VIHTTPVEGLPHSLVFGSATLFFGKLPTEETEDKSPSVTPTEVQLEGHMFFKKLTFITWCVLMKVLGVTVPRVTQCMTGVDPSGLPFSLGSHRHSSISLLFSFRFVDS
jgi:hypothetical protein